MSHLRITPERYQELQERRKQEAEGRKLAAIERSTIAQKPADIPLPIPKAKNGRKVAKKPPKHGNHKVFEGGVKVADSKREHKRWLELVLLQKAGNIQHLEKQVPFELVPSVILDGRKKPPVKYLADFVYWKGDVQVIEDAKSPHLRKDPVFRLKKHLMKSVHNLDIIEV